MIKCRPHKLTATIESSQEPYQDENGDMVFPDVSDPVVIETECRAESNTVDGRKLVEDGVNYDYSYLVFTDVNIAYLPMNTKIEITVPGRDELFGKGELLRFERGQRVTRIWVR